MNIKGKNNILVITFRFKIQTYNVEIYLYLSLNFSINTRNGYKLNCISNILKKIAI